MNDARSSEQIWNQFDPVTRTWWVSPAFFAYVQEQILADQRWIETQFTGVGEIKLQVLHDHERRQPHE
jgi:hypothetical protein